ncbi:MULTISPECIES: phosphatase PAP2 family protein [Agrobacterium]|uniref:phosphatase PAP2 family protein n=1 Tax=Agrobacterium TaxID=357 RepID=UPI000DDC1EA3|nr:MULTISPECIES: phosphatase PAP2 family protein [Agrobacterium]MBO9110971.1 phosphatase PAP2 family protein [Agrobacterium sp. S2/73]NTA18093.1 phosphatase PAP2 family protein [Agrobacterium tumefaciens]NTD89365.1 phosphatase PAP2 family protein [Agrobacterium tumefaciens]NTD94048.1 phosphatase PAP2 family protein [Agrobacterium tumefaciens]NTE00212.1 phosphatase PAP2 family protein [Agrobacterium tumefaciens]
MHQYLSHKTEQKWPGRPEKPKFRFAVIPTARQTFAWVSRSPSLLALSTTLAMMVFFTVRPDIDLDASRWFWTDGFRLGEDQFLISVRDLNRALPAILLSTLVCLLLATPFVSGVRRAIRPHKLLLVLTFYALGPGATVHVLKNLFGRARPRHISEFGADLFFTPVLSLDGSCSRNCSFPSGESASAIALLAFIIFLPEKFRLSATAILMPFIVLCSLNRAAMGAHFLSDVLIAWPLMLAVFLSLHRLFTKHGDTIDTVLLR